ncbi:hypothetical protein [Xanthobacter versatilis]|uniref:hypothetical protein n=1 Tax=Xanthobacter autotrophicus (strain ATCC BAA-1158 / Py2) TaxID=78245 RepID=UPI0037277EC0
MSFNKYGFEEVEYDIYHQQFAAPFLIDGNTANNRYFLHEAQQTHIYGVNNALLELLGDGLTLLSAVSFAKEADHFFRYGVMRRLRMIDSSFKSFQTIVPPNRILPLSQDQSDRACRDLNAIYIDLLGLLDNYAWVAVYQTGSAPTRAAGPMSIGLFKPAFKAEVAFQPLIAAMKEFDDWEKDVKTRRNPAVHRMPLYVPSAALTPEDVSEFERIEAQISRALHAQEFEKLTSLRDSQQRIGTLIPKFLHDPDEPVMDIYPTVPADIGQAIKIGRIMQSFLREQGTQ